MVTSYHFSGGLGLSEVVYASFDRISILYSIYDVNLCPRQIAKSSVNGSQQY